MEAKENEIEQEIETLQAQLSKPGVYQQPDYPQLAKRFKEISELKQKFVTRNKLLKDRADLESNFTDQDQDSKQILAAINDELASVEQDINRHFNQQHKDDSKDCIIEIRAGVGGDEATLFALELFKMYSRFIDAQKWQTVVLNTSHSEAGGLKEIIFEVNGQRVYQRLKFEAGVHRVQRVPKTESQGRIHTSTATVAVMPQVSQQELDIKDSDIRIDTYRSSGHGGQSVNKTDSAVRITHLASGLIVTCQDEKSQLKNKNKALGILRARLVQKQTEAAQSDMSKQRQKMIGSGNRNEKIRTYNYPQDRLTDHRIGYSTGNLNAIMQGDLDDILDKLTEAENALDNDS